MGIRRRNWGEQVIVIGQDGAAVADDNLGGIHAEFDGFIKNVYASVAVAGVTGTMSIDVNKNGSSIFSSGTIDFTTGTEPNSYPSVASQAVSKGDRFTIDIDAIHSGTAAENPVLHLVISRKRPGDVENLSPANQK